MTKTGQYQNKLQAFKKLRLFRQCLNKHRGYGAAYSYRYWENQIVTSLILDAKAGSASAVYVLKNA